MAQAGAHHTRTQHQRMLPAGDVLYPQGSQGRTVCSVYQGAVKLELSSPDGQSRVVRVERLLPCLTRGHASPTCQALCREDMASLIDLTPETVSRTMAAFKLSGLASDRSHVSVCKLAGGLMGISQWRA